MKITYKHTLPIEKSSKLDTHKTGVYAVAQLVNLDHLKIVMASPQEKMVDLIITNKRSNKRYRVKVLASKKPAKKTSVGYGISWVVDKDSLKPDQTDLFFCFVHIANTKKELNLKFFVVPSTKVYKYIHSSFDYWLSESDTRDESNPIDKFLLGIDGEKYPAEFETLMQEDYEDNWDQLK